MKHIKKFESIQNKKIKDVIDIIQTYFDLKIEIAWELDYGVNTECIAVYCTEKVDDNIIQSIKDQLIDYDGYYLLSVEKGSENKGHGWDGYVYPSGATMLICNSEFQKIRKSKDIKIFEEIDFKPHASFSVIWPHRDIKHGHLSGDSISIVYGPTGIEGDLSKKIEIMTPLDDNPRIYYNKVFASTFLIDSQIKILGTNKIFN